MCKTVWNLALSQGLNSDSSRSSKWAQTSSRSKVKLYWNCLELGPNSTLQNLALNVPYHWHGGNPSCVVVVKIDSEHWSRCSTEDGGVGAGVLRTALVTQRYECLKSWCMDRTSPELLPAEEPGQASPRAVWQGEWVTAKSDTPLHHQAFSGPVQAASSSSYWRPGLPHTLLSLRLDDYEGEFS